MKGLLVWAVAEDGRAEGLERRHVAGDEVDVVAEEGGQRHAEHGSHEEQEQHVEPAINIHLSYSYYYSVT